MPFHCASTGTAKVEMKSSILRSMETTWNNWIMRPVVFGVRGLDSTHHISNRTLLCGVAGRSSPCSIWDLYQPFILADHRWSPPIHEIQGTIGEAVTGWFVKMDSTSATVICSTAIGWKPATTRQGEQIDSSAVPHNCHPHARPVRLSAKRCSSSLRPGVANLPREASVAQWVQLRRI